MEKKLDKKSKTLILLWPIIFLILFLVVIITQEKTPPSFAPKAQNTPVCNPNNLQMSVSPNPARVGNNIEFTLSGTEGDTWISDSWIPSGGVDCQGDFWGKKICKALQPGIYQWTHSWRKCFGAITNCSDVCTKSTSFVIESNQIPTNPTPTINIPPTSTPLPSPTSILLSTPTPTTTPTPTLTPTPQLQTIRVTMTLKFQGITQTPKFNNQIQVKLIFKNEKREINYQTIQNFRINENLLAVSEPFEINLPFDNKYIILIKGEKHIQRKICHLSPQESVPGGYLCGNSNYLTLNSNQINLNFSNVSLTAGDLPPQDGILNSYDLSLVRNNLNKTDSDVLAKADLNLDAIVDSQDFSILLASMSVKTDEF